MSPILGDALVNSRWWFSSHRRSLHASETNFNQPPLRFCSTEETDLEANYKKASIPSASYDSSSVFQEKNMYATSYCRRVVDTNTRQNRTFDPGGSQGHLCASPFLRSWRALVCGEVIRSAAFFRRRFAGSLKQGRL